MKTTNFTHVGHFKTGTTALQVFRVKNADRFRKVGLHYAESHREDAKQSALAFALYHAAGVRELMHGYDDDTPPEMLWREFFDEVRHGPEPTVLASSEEFMRLGAWHEAADRRRRIIGTVAGEFDFRIIAYLRPPQAHRPAVDAGFGAAAEQARCGIEALGAIKGGEFDTAPLLAAFPRPQASDSLRPGQLFRFLLQEQARMQHRQRKKFADHTARIEALEARLAALADRKTD
ncbi:MAG: hypothetical protein JJT95_08585 [Pararhodobacter sp.]|nr:hypothetical protein [Pararhodobacter sp.]